MAQMVFVKVEIREPQTGRVSVPAKQVDQIFKGSYTRLRMRRGVFEPLQLFLHSLTFRQHTLPLAHVHRAANRGEKHFVVFRVPDASQGQHLNRDFLTAILVSIGGYFFFH